MSYPSRPFSGARLAAAALIALSSLAAHSAQADELSIRPSLQLFEEYSTNPTRSERRDLAEPGYAFRYKPGLEVERRGARGFAKVDLGLSGRDYHDSDLDDLDAIDRYGDFKFEYALTQRLAIFGSGGYLFAESRDAVFADGLSESVLLTSQRPETETLSGQIGLRYAFNQRSSVELSAFMYDFDYDLPGLTENAFDPFRDRRDFSSNVAALSYNYIFGPKDSGFVQFSYRSTEFDPATLIQGDPWVLMPERDPETDLPLFTEDGDPIEFFDRDSAQRQFLPTAGGQDDDQYSVTAGWARQWTPKLRTSISGGMTRLHTERDEFHIRIPGEFPIIEFGDDGRVSGLVYPFSVIPPEDGSSSSFTGGASLSRTFKRGRLELFASKETRPSSSVSASIDETSYGASYMHRFSGRVTANFRVTNEFREAANDNGFDDTARIRRYDLSLSWRLRERLYAFSNASSTDSVTDDVFFNSFSEYRVSAGLRYSFGIDELSPF